MSWGTEGPSTRRAEDRPLAEQAWSGGPGFAITVWLLCAVPTTACRGARVPDRPEPDAVVDRAQGHVLTARGGLAKDMPRGRAGAEAAGVVACSRSSLRRNACQRRSTSVPVMPVHEDHLDVWKRTRRSQTPVSAAPARR